MISALIFLTGCAGLRGSGKVVSEERSVGSFKTVAIASGFVANVGTGPRGVTVRTDDNVMKDVQVFVKGDELVVRLNPDTWVEGTSELSVIVNNDTIQGLDASGGSIVEAHATGCDQVPISASGGSQVKLSGVDARSLLLDASGGSQITVSGSASTAAAAGSGGSHLNLTGVPLSTLDLDLSGGSTLDATVRDSVRGSASGGSVVTLGGHPTFDVDRSGGSTVNTDGP